MVLGITATCDRRNEQNCRHRFSEIDWTYSNRHLQSACGFKNSRSATQSAVATDAEQNIVAVLLDAGQDGIQLEST
jgi:hypothetical protein